MPGQTAMRGTVNDNVHIHLSGINESSAITNIRVSERDAAGVWANPCVPGSTWMTHVEISVSGERDLYFKPYRYAPAGTVYEILVEYADGSSQTTTVGGNGRFPITM